LVFVYFLYIEQRFSGLKLMATTMS